MATILLGTMSLMTALVVVAAQAPQGELVTRIHTGSVQDRELAVIQALQISPDQRSGGLVRALADELSRVNGLVEKRRLQPGVIESEWDEVAIGEYMGSLVQANAQSTASVVLAPLIGAISTGRMASNAVARFGSTALPQLLTIVQDANNYSMARIGAADALRSMLQQSRLSQAERQKVIALAKTVLTRREPQIVVGIAMDFAVATGDLELRGLVQQIAQNPSRALAVPADSGTLSTLQKRAQKILAGRAGSVRIP